MANKANKPVSIAVIGGSGLYKMKGLQDASEVRVKTPFGPPSDAVLVGTLAGVRAAFLPRHGRSHTILPGEINGRANIWALKSLGVERILAMAAVGSLREDLPPRHFVFPDQLADETKGRASTFFGGGIVGHVSFARPFCPGISELAHRTAAGLGIHAHRGGTYVCMEGPSYSSRAESEMHRQLGYSIIGMTAVGEAKLAREAEICYSIAAMVTDYDCWKEDDEVSTEKVLAHLHANVANAQALIEAVLPPLSRLERACPCGRSLEGSVITSRAAMRPAALKKIALILGKHAR